MTHTYSKVHNMFSVHHTTCHMTRGSGNSGKAEMAESAKKAVERLSCSTSDDLEPFMSPCLLGGKRRRNNKMAVHGVTAVRWKGLALESSLIAFRLV